MPARTSIALSSRTRPQPSASPLRLPWRRNGRRETRVKLHPDLHDPLAAFAQHRVRYLLIGGYAMAVHAKPRFTKDLDLWIDAAPNNLDAVANAFAEFGAPSNVIAPLHSAPAMDVLWFGIPPNRIDLMKGVPGGDFAAMHRAQDLVDAKNLE